MVRLKANLRSKAQDSHAFQFHYGTIKRLPDSLCRYVSGVFQFHYGTIKRTAARMQGGFVAIFQFHYGTIKRVVRTQTNGGGLGISIPLWYD